MYPIAVHSFNCVSNGASVTVESPNHLCQCAVLLASTGKSPKLPERNLEIYMYVSTSDFTYVHMYMYVWSTSLKVQEWNVSTV